MKISLRWLNDYLDRPVALDEAERVLTNIGFPIDGTEESAGDVVMDVEVTSNRPDLLSHVGVARELAAATGRVLKQPAASCPETGPAADSISSITNDQHDLCPQYTARILRGVKVGPSPAWLAERLQAIGLRPVNNIVDITNYVLHELGQPLHAFDLDRLAERRIVVRRATAGEPFTAIDGSKHKLRKDMLVIADAKSPQAVAGVMGGLTSEVGESTTNVLLESAQFDPLSIRTTSRALKLASDSSYRFERGVDALGVEAASRRAAVLILELAGGELATGVLSQGRPLPAPALVTLRPQRCEALLGISIPRQRMIDLLAGLGLQPHDEGERIACTVPSHRLDLQREVDLIEEIARLHGYDHLPMQEKMSLIVRRPQRSVLARQAVAKVLVAHGYCEAINFSFIAPAMAEPFAEGRSLIRVDEEKKKAEPALRPSLLPSLLQTRKSNQDAGNRDVKLFEIAQTFAGAAAEGGAIDERRSLAMVIDAPEPAGAMRAMRGTIDELLRELGVREIVFAPAEAGTVAWAADSAAAIITTADQPLGRFGLLHTRLQKHFDLQTAVMLAELDYPTLVRNYPPQPTVRPLPRYPAIERDLSILIAEATRWDAVQSLIDARRPPLLEQVDFVTVYRGKQVEKGRKSLTLRMTFRHPDRTLQHEEVTEQMDQLVAAMAAELQAQVPK